MNEVEQCNPELNDDEDINHDPSPNKEEPLLNSHIDEEVQEDGTPEKR